ncbi:phosphatase domain-containing protein [Sulfitobacter sp. HNIBRBA3233]|uniref:App1 family protein n=1 Tax=Sulfitobacter marinivivus TaxID=3158558 RepID=UPI0032DEEDF9
MIRNILHRVAYRAERVIDRFAQNRDSRRIIEPYLGYAEPGHIVLRGRVLTALRRNKPKPTQSRWTNFRQMVSLFMTDEVADVAVEAEGFSTRTDEEGYFTLHLPILAKPGWSEYTVTIPDQSVSAVCPVMVPDRAADFGVISDIDDTVLETGAYSLLRNLWTSLTGNAMTRRIFPDAVAFLDDLHADGRNPVYFVSSSPWNLHHFLLRIFDLASLVRAPMFLRDLGVSEDKFISGTHGSHKGSAVDLLMKANPELAYVLVGDTGQHDASVYRDAIARHPGRVLAVVLREPGPGPDEEGKAAIRQIEGSGVPVFHAPGFEGFSDQIFALLPATMAGNRSGQG